MSNVLKFKPRKRELIQIFVRAGCHPEYIAEIANNLSKQYGVYAGWSLSYDMAENEGDVELFYSDGSSKRDPLDIEFVAEDGDDSC